MSVWNVILLGVRLFDQFMYMQDLAVCLKHLFNFNNQLKYLYNWFENADEQMLISMGWTAIYVWKCQV